MYNTINNIKRDVIIIYYVIKYVPITYYVIYDITDLLRNLLFEEVWGTLSNYTAFTKWWGEGRIDEGGGNICALG